MPQTWPPTAAFGVCFRSVVVCPCLFTGLGSPSSSFCCVSWPPWHPPPGIAQERSSRECGHVRGEPIRDTLYGHTPLLENMLRDVASKPRKSIRNSEILRCPADTCRSLLVARVSPPQTMRSSRRCKCVFPLASTHPTLPTVQGRHGGRQRTQPRRSRSGHDAPCRPSRYARHPRPSEGVAKLSSHVVRQNLGKLPVSSQPHWD